MSCAHPNQIKCLLREVGFREARIPFILSVCPFDRGWGPVRLTQEVAKHLPELCHIPGPAWLRKRLKQARGEPSHCVILGRGHKPPYILQCHPSWKAIKNVDGPCREILRIMSPVEDRGTQVLWDKQLVWEHLLQKEILTRDRR